MRSQYKKRPACQFKTCRVVGIIALLTFLPLSTVGANTPELVKDINVGVDESLPQFLTDVNGTLFFGADNGATGTELWKSDGTDGGTVLVKDINPGLSSSLSGGLTNFNGTLYFPADDGINGTALWKSDGTSGGTEIVLDGLGQVVPFPNGFAVVNNTLFFSAFTVDEGWELWKTDGTPGGTVIVKDINPGGGIPGSSNPTFLINFNGTLYFQANDGANGAELWKSDGTSAVP